MADLETDENWEILHETQSLENWVRREITGKIGYDPMLTPISIFSPLCCIEGLQEMLIFSDI